MRSADASSPTRISPVEAHAKMTNEGYTYVDIRAEEDFEAGHPKGAINVPFAGGQLVAVMERTFAKDAPLILGCAKGVASARAARALVAAGFTRVLEQRAGWDGTRGTFGEILEPGWRRVGLPVAAGASEPSDR